MPRCAEPAETAPPAWIATPPDATSVLWAPNATPSASTAPRVVNAATGTLRSAGSSAKSAWVRVEASVGVVVSAAHVPPRLLQPTAIARTRPGRPLASNHTLNAAAGGSPADAASPCGPAEGQLQVQPAPLRMQAA